MRNAVATCRRVFAPVLLIATLLLVTSALWREAGGGHPMSVVDEHMHLDTHVRVHAGSYPHRGSLMTMDVVREWACGVGHEGGGTTVACGDPGLGPPSLPSGAYTTGYIHYPTYFVAAEGYRVVAGALGGGGSFVDTYRHFAALVTALGLLTCLCAGWSLGLRGAALLAATFAPSATAGILLYGTIANPQSAGVLTGSLIAWGGLRWVTTGRGFWWLAAATGLASAVAVVHSLPAGVFMVAMVAALVLRRMGWTVRGPWRPRWWQVGVLALVVTTPVVVYGRWISSHATMSNARLYSFASFDSWSTVVVGAVAELSVLHTPWYETGSLAAPADASVVRQLLRAAVQGVPLWLTIAVFAPLAVVAGHAYVVARRDARRTVPPGATTHPRSFAPVPLLAAAAFVTLLLFPPVLRLSNAVNVGFDHPVVSRYAISFTPVLVLLLLLSVRGRPTLTRALAVLGTVGVLGVALAIW